MEKIEGMERYIARTNLRRSLRYGMMLDEICALNNMFAERPLDALSLAFEYGKAKGYRAAKSEQAREAESA